MSPRSRRIFLPAIVILALLASCKKPGRLDLLLRPSEDLELAAVDELEVRLLDARDGHEMGRANVAGTDLDALPNLFDRSPIDPHVPYVFEVRAEVAAEVCASGRVVGRSLAVEVASDDAVGAATMYVACAESASPTGRMHVARVGHAAIWAPVQGGALFLGGASQLGSSNATYEGLDSIERYDVATGRFTELPALLEPRFMPGAALDADGRVFVMGGGPGGSLVDQAFEWVDTVEEVDGDARRGKGLLDSKWPRPVVLPLSDGTVALFGFGIHGLALPVQATFYDPATETNARGYLTRGLGEYNLLAVAMAGRDRALLVGAFDEANGEARPSLFCASGCCEAPGPCFVPLGEEGPPARPGPSNWGPGPAWKEAAGAWLACPDGGGTVTITGGHLGASTEALDDIWCYEDAEGEPSREGLSRIGGLNHARWGHGMVAIRPGHVLVVGGTAGPNGSVEQAEILRVDPCSCAPLDDADVTEAVIDPSLDNVGRGMWGGSEVVLGDGTVLLSGAMSANAALDLVADDEAWVFMPDLP